MPLQQHRRLWMHSRMHLGVTSVEWYFDKHRRPSTEYSGSVRELVGAPIRAIRSRQERLRPTTLANVQVAVLPQPSTPIVPIPPRLSQEFCRSWDARPKPSSHRAVKPSSLLMAPSVIGLLLSLCSSATPAFQLSLVRTSARHQVQPSLSPPPSSSPGSRNLFVYSLYHRL